MVSRIRNAIADEHFGDYVMAALPVVCIILGAIAFTVIALVKAQ